MSKIALFGATGTIGSRVLHEALDRGHQVTAVVHDPAKLTDPGAASVVRGDVLDPASVAGAAAGQDLVVSAFRPGDGEAGALVAAVKSLIGGVQSLGADTPRPRLITVGGAGSLRTPAGPMVWDQAGIPEPVLAVMHAHGEALDFLLTVPVDEVRWTCLSPPARVEPGERTGTYRLGLDNLIVDDAGESRISVEDYAVALVDEIERDAHAGKRFTIGY
ncbi:MULTISPECIES: NAD(P)-dependent oxidoreductase [unclassified Streptomyces]|uniref:NAD(P)-dependent oxidoreductase n=1 Tax=unclassified Streptomyces TaxID=2593676 RepID=UPI001BE6E668|nr:MULTISPECIES: NAD(P)H-binding protein [unclassified Streptomyces]MBT2404206.1 NAD(P)H-binding protein [Streptomyces sp. ISL-21]MBT2458831.1 NAD(P)H-binding protein [Streptomyces sp. ISL-86]MBT2612883.1 NAD(P)H-binding protein [Streptomyces sp. ISL-87]